MKVALQSMDVSGSLVNGQVYTLEVIDLEARALIATISNTSSAKAYESMWTALQDAVSNTGHFGAPGCNSGHVHSIELSSPAGVVARFYALPD